MLNLLRDGRPQAIDRLHLTLAITPDSPVALPLLAQAMRNVGDAVAANPFVLTLDTVTCIDTHVGLRPSRRNLELNTLQRLIVAEMARHGVPLRPGWTFNPHVTLSYDGRDEPRRRVPPIRLVVEDFVLIHSESGLTRHHRLGQWPLHGEPGTDLFGFTPFAA